MKRIVALCLAAACLISMVGCAGDTNMDEKKPNNSASAYALALASYPEMAPYPNEMEYFDEKTGEFDSDGFDVVYDAYENRHGKADTAQNAHAVSRKAMQTVWNRSSPVQSESFSAIPTGRTRYTLL